MSVSIAIGASITSLGSRPSAPRENVAPVVGSVTLSPADAAVGSLVSASVSLSAGYPYPSLAYQWTLDALDIPGATGPAFFAEAEGDLRCVVTATNIAGTGIPFTSAPLAIGAAPTIVIDQAAVYVGDVLGASVTATVTGSPTTVVWFVNSSSISLPYPVSEGEVIQAAVVDGASRVVAVSGERTVMAAAGADPVLTGAMLTATESGTEAGKIVNTFPGLSAALTSGWSAQLWIGPTTTPGASNWTTLTTAHLIDGRTTSTAFTAGSTQYCFLRARRDADGHTLAPTSPGVSVTLAGSEWVIDDSADGMLVFDADLAVGATHVSVDVTSPVEYAGTYAAPLADLATGPVAVVDPVVAGDSGEGNVLTATPGLWIGEGYIDFTREWRNGVAVLGTGETYTQTAADQTNGVEYVETATDANGTRAETVTAVALPTFNFVRFSGDTRILEDGKGHLPTTKTAFTYAATIEIAPQALLRTVLRFDGALINIEADNDVVGGSFTGNPADYMGAMRFDTAITEKRRYNILFTASAGATLPSGNNAELWVNGVLVNSKISATWTTFNVDRLRIAESAVDVDIAFVWAAPSSIDPATHYSTFFSGSDPASLPEDGAVGSVLPTFYVKGPASVWNAGTNLGTGVDFSMQGGAVTDV